ncbi:hypothetical protein T02_5711 [Trichinella nativa]|uniref:Uncharacterized protein n=2 Tax=Trichinella TaxID=6333 RepID=A0A0V1LJL9_9BILA|nr:hypothetical protein T09_5415 [Trichinella sp. T9]KRY46300.1 hypothetical protein T03_5562 [Trichinella britovi]KRZ59723.1 hypothetical protein T02_5711 [Trichinella nativa]
MYKGRKLNYYKLLAFQFERQYQSVEIVCPGVKLCLLKAAQADAVLNDCTPTADHICQRVAFEANKNK